jgi:cation transport regulator ChaB
VVPSFSRLALLGCLLSAEQKFLKALGYLSTLDRPQEVDEQIQMHADSLYHRMLDQETAIEEAKAEGRPIPTFPPLLSPKVPKATTNMTPIATSEVNHVKASDLPPKVQESFKKRLEGLSEDERVLEERAIKAEIQAGEQVAGHLTTIFEKQEAERKKRKEEGRETIADKVTSIFRWQ